MIEQWLFNKDRFCIAQEGDFSGLNDTCYWGLPSIQASDPAFPPLGYWRGYVWGPMAQLTYLLRTTSVDISSLSLSVSRSLFLPSLLPLLLLPLSLSVSVSASVHFFACHICTGRSRYWGLKNYDHVPSVRKGRKALVKQMGSLMMSQWVSVDLRFGLPRECVLATDLIVPRLLPRLISATE